MDKAQHFSLEDYLADWSRVRETISVEGTLQQDGDYFVIDRDPRNPSSLLRVRQADVTDHEPLRTVRFRGSERQIYRISIKRNVPVQSISIISSDVLRPRPFDARPLISTVSVSFESNVSGPHTWTIWDENADPPTQKFNDTLDLNDVAGPFDFESDGVVGNASYQKDGGDKTFVNQITDGGKYLMN
jgi:hypothetical protein